MPPSESAVHAATAPDDVPPRPGDVSRRHSYTQILWSSALIGGSAVVTTAAGILRAKVMALLLGPAGVGLMGLYGSVADLTVSIAGLGVNSSGVRQMAEAAGSGELSRIARTAAVLRRTSVILGMLGGLFLVLFSGPVSTWTFGSDTYWVSVAFLSIAVACRLISDGQAALIQGMRRIGDLARIGVLSALGGTALTVVFVYFLRERGIVPSLVAAAAMTLVAASWFSRKVDIPPASLSATQVREEAGALLNLGAAFMLSAVLSTGAAYAIRIMVRDGLGIEAAGLYQAAWTLGGLYVAFILQSMGSDFYPRLTAVVNDSAECNRVVNEQAHVSMLLAGPGVLGTLTFAPLVIGLFYDRNFGGAVEPLRWICMGMALRIVAWPMGFIVLAKGARMTLVLTEVAAVAMHLGIAFVLMRRFGLPGATMGFFALYVWHSLLVYFIVRRWTGFRWSRANVRTGVLFLAANAIVFGGFLSLSERSALALGLAATAWSAVYSWRSVRRLLASDALPHAIRRHLT